MDTIEMKATNVRVPEEWTEEADDRDLTTAEYCRRMVRAGRRQYGFDYEPGETPVEQKSLKLDEKATAASIDTELQEWILNNLSTEEAIDPEGLVTLLEDEILDLADELCDQGKAKYRPSEGGYLKTSNE